MFRIGGNPPIIPLHPNQPRVLGSARRQASAVAWRIFAAAACCLMLLRHAASCCSILRHASTCTCGYLLTMNPKFTSRQHTQSCWAKLILQKKGGRGYTQIQLFQARNIDHDGGVRMNWCLHHGNERGQQCSFASMCPRFTCKKYSVTSFHHFQAHGPLKQPYLTSGVLHKGCSKASQTVLLLRDHSI